MSIQLQAAEPTLKSFRVGPGDVSVPVKERRSGNGLFQDHPFHTKDYSSSNILRIYVAFLVPMNLAFRASTVLSHASLKQLHSSSVLNL